MRRRFQSILLDLAKFVLKRLKYIHEDLDRSLKKSPQNPFPFIDVGQLELAESVLDKNIDKDFRTEETIVLRLVV